MRCITQYFRKLRLIRENTITDKNLMDDLYLTRLMREHKWEQDFQHDMIKLMIFNRAWKERFVRRLKAL